MKDLTINTGAPRNVLGHVISGAVASATTGLPPAALIQGQPIVWGCTLITGAESAFKYVPSNCRYVNP